MNKAFHRVALWAAGSFVAGLSMVVPNSLNAVASNDAASVIEKPKFAISGCSITLESNLPDGKAAWAAGDKPNFKIAAVNDSDADQDLTFNVSISSLSPGSEMRRAPAMPTEVENVPVSLHVPAGKTATTEVSCEKAIPASFINVQMISGASRMQMASINTSPAVLMNGNLAINSQAQVNVNR